jgi:hypothetical protein
MAAAKFFFGRFIIFFAVTLTYLSNLAYCKTLNIKADGIGDYPTIQAAIVAAFNGDEIVLQPGIYTGDGNRNIDFFGKALTVRGADPNNPSIVSNTVIDCQGISGSLRRGFYLHRGETRSSEIAGLTITNGFADGSWPSNTGGAIYCDGSSPTIKLCRILKNRAKMHGGGIYCTLSSPEIKYCQISNNTIDSWFGGGIFCIKGDPVIYDCDINNNSAVQGGGGLYCRENNVSVRRCRIFANHSVESGGGIYTFQCNDAKFSNCLIATNSSARGVPAIMMVEGHPKINLCTIVKNTGYPQGAVCCNNQEGGTATITNCIIWDNRGWYQIWGNVNSSFCDVGKAGYSGGGNINIDPSFISPNDGNFNLSSLSPCINAGDPDYMIRPNETDLNGKTRIMSGRVDMGAYEFFNHIPVANAGSDQTVYAWFDGVAKVILDGTGSYDDDGQPLTYLWTWTIDGNNFTATGPSPIITLPAGEHTIELIVNDGLDNSDPNWVTVIVIPPVETSVNLTPKTLNLDSNGQYLKAHFVLPEGYTIEEIDVNTPATLEPPGIKSQYINVFINDANLVEIEVAFDRSTICLNGLDYGTTEIAVVGLFTSGQYFYGIDTIRITAKNLEQFATFASHWLESDCTAPDWCYDTDLDYNSTINLADFSIFNRCCIEVVK